MATTLRKTFYIRVNGLAASRDFAPSATGAFDKAIDQAIAARPDAIIQVVEMYGNKELGAMLVHKP